MSTPMRVAITGTSGFIGAVVAERALAAGHVVRGSSRSTMLSGAETILGDLQSPRVRAQVVDGVDAVVHCAGVLRSTDERSLIAMNVDVTAGLCRAALSAGVGRFVLISSTGVYGQPGGLIDEQSPHRPANPYERSKDAGEAAARSIVADDALVVVRPSNVLGERRRGRPLLRLLRKLQRGRLMYSGSAFANYVDVDDVAMVVLRALDAEAPGAVIVNDPLRLSLFISVARDILGAPDRHDRIIPGLIGQVSAAIMEPLRCHHQVVGRTMALVDDTRFTSLQRLWSRGSASSEDSTRRVLSRMVCSYRREGLL